MERNSRRHSNGFGYIGFGNNPNVFNQYSRKAFSSLKEKLHKETHLHFKLDFLHKNLTKEEKQIIKNKIRKQEKQRTIKALTLSSILLIMVLFFIKILIGNIMARF